MGPRYPGALGPNSWPSGHPAAAGPRDRSDRSDRLVASVATIASTTERHGAERGSDGPATESPEPTIRPLICRFWRFCRVGGIARVSDAPLASARPALFGPGPRRAAWTPRRRDRSARPTNGATPRSFSSSRASHSPFRLVLAAAALRPCLAHQPGAFRPALQLCNVLLEEIPRHQLVHDRSLPSHLLGPIVSDNHLQRYYTGYQ